MPKPKIYSNYEEQSYYRANPDDDFDYDKRFQQIIK